MASISTIWIWGLRTFWEPFVDQYISKNIPNNIIYNIIYGVWWVRRPRWAAGQPLFIEKQLFHEKEGSLTKTGSSKDHRPAPNYVARLFRLESGQQSKVQNPKNVSPNLEFSGHVTPSISIHSQLKTISFNGFCINCSYSIYYFTEYYC